MGLSKLICVIWVFQVCFFIIFIFYYYYYYYLLFFILFDFEKMTLTVVPLNSGGMSLWELSLVLYPFLVVANPFGPVTVSDSDTVKRNA